MKNKMKYNGDAVRYLIVSCSMTMLFLCATHVQAAEIKALSQGDSFALLASVQAMHRGSCSPAGPSVAVFEVGGGDPAMNGAFIYVRIDHNERSFVWKTGLNVRSVRTLTFGPGNAILLKVDEDMMDSNSAIVQRTAVYSICYHLDGDVLLDMITIGSSSGHPCPNQRVE